MDFSVAFLFFAYYKSATNNHSAFILEIIEQDVISSKSDLVRKIEKGQVFF